MTTSYSSGAHSLLSPGMIAVLAAQFLSALADNAILVIAIAMVRSNSTGHEETLLQGAFVLPFLMLAPFAGPLADGFPKARVMLAANLLKLAGALCMAARFSPFFAYGIIGIGATLYSPAKYGILTQLVDPGRIVRANSMLEGSTIVAILLGVLTGGWLTDQFLHAALFVLVALYLAAAAANLFIPHLSPERPLNGIRPGDTLAGFLSSIKSLLSNPDSRFSLLGTSIFWGCGVTLRLLLFAWVPAALSLTNNRTPAVLMGVLSIGIVLGAAAAGIWISLKTTGRALIGGLLLGPFIFVMAAVSDIGIAVLVMVLVGFCGGWFLVPLNALLQETGHLSVGSGKALAVQNFCENLAMLLFLGAYSFANNRLPVMQSVRGFGIVIVMSMLCLMVLALNASKKPRFHLKEQVEPPPAEAGVSR